MNLQVNDEDKYPWIAQLIVNHILFGENPVHSSPCSATLVCHVNVLFALVFGRA